jgi:hypothetical protein
MEFLVRLGSCRPLSPPAWSGAPVWSSVATDAASALIFCPLSVAMIPSGDYPIVSSVHFLCASFPLVSSSRVFFKSPERKEADYSTNYRNRAIFTHHNPNIKGAGAAQLAAAESDGATTQGIGNGARVERPGSWSRPLRRLKVPFFSCTHISYDYFSDNIMDIYLTN